MPVYAVNYDLKRPGQNYEGLHQAIQSLGDWWHFLDSTWLVDTAMTAGQIWARLQPHVDQSDSVLVVRVTQDTAGWLEQSAWTWINQRL